MNRVTPQTSLDAAQGRRHLFKFTTPDLEKAIELCQKAVERDPNYAWAWDTMVPAYFNLAASVGDPPPDLLPKTKEAARRALAIDPELPDAHAVTALIALT